MIKVRIASENNPGDFGGIRIPNSFFDPNSSTFPPTFVAITGLPKAIDSIIELENPSP